MWKKFTAVLALVAMIVVAPGTSFAQTSDVAVHPIQCAMPDVHPRVTVNVPASAVSGQIFFKAEGTTAEYYIDLRKAPDGTMWAYLPAPLPSTRSFTYRAVTLDSAGRRASSPLMTVSTSAACPAVPVADVEKPAATSLAIGLTNNSQQIVPTGFECKDVVSYITVAGELKPNDECRKAAAPGATTAEEAGMKRDTMLALLLIGIGGAGVAVYQHNQGPKDTPVVNPLSSPRP